MHCTKRLPQMLIAVPHLPSPPVESASKAAAREEEAAEEGESGGGRESAAVRGGGESFWQGREGGARLYGHDGHSGQVGSGRADHGEDEARVHEAVTDSSSLVALVASCTFGSFRTVVLL